MHHSGCPDPQEWRVEFLADAMGALGQRSSEEVRDSHGDIKR